MVYTSARDDAAVPSPDAGAISLRLYPHNELDDPTAIVDELLAQAALASEAGFDGAMTSEHHGGFAGYSPNPLQLAGWMLEVATFPVAGDEAPAFYAEPEPSS